MAIERQIYQESSVKITREEIVDRQTVLLIELEEEDLDPYLDRGYRRVVQRTVIPGFRKGKAPRWRVEQMLGRESLLNEVLDTMLPEVTTSAITEQDLDAAGLPKLELLGIDPVSLKATVPLSPEVDLPSYKDIRIAQEPVDVTEEGVQQRLEQMRQGAASWEPVERPVQMGDLVTIEAVGTVLGRTILNEKDALFFLDEDSIRPFPGFSQSLVGLAIDTPKEFTLTIPEDYSDQTIAGNEAHFSVTVSEVKEQVLPELDDEFAKGVGDGYDSLEALRQQVEKDLRAEAGNEADQKHRESVMKALLADATIELSPLMVEREAEHIEDDRTMVLSRVSVRMDDYLRSIGKTLEEMRSEMREQAVERLRRTFLLSKVAEAEGVEVSDEEVEERVESLLSESSEGAPRTQDSDELRSSVRRMFLADKTMDRLVAIAKGEAPLGEPDDKPAEERSDETQSTQEEGDGTDDRQA